MGFRDQGFHRRKFPRRAFKRRVGVLVGGEYFLCDSEEIGEGGMSFEAGQKLADNAQIVVNFRIPGGDFVSLRGQIRSNRGSEGRFIVGVSFENIAFSLKRQIRSFVSARSSKDSVLV